MLLTETSGYHPRWVASHSDDTDVEIDTMSLRLVAYRDFREVHNDWLEVERQYQLSPFQSYDWCNCFWQSGIAGPKAELHIIAGYNESGSLSLILPLVLKRGFFFTVGEILGDANAAHRAPVVTPDLLRDLDAGGARRIVQESARLAGCDTVLMPQQPAQLFGISNPWQQAGAVIESDAIADALLNEPWEKYDAAHRSAKTRSKERNRENGLRRLGTVEFDCPTSPEKQLEILEVILAQKSRALKARGSYMFDNPATIKFLRSLVLIDRQGQSFAQLCALRVGGEQVAGSLGVIQGSTFSGLILSVDDGPSLRYSPGQLLISKLLRNMMESGITRFSFGLGESDLKVRWTDESTPVFSIAYPRTRRGIILSRAAQFFWRTKAWFKRNRIAYRWASHVRKIDAIVRHKSQAREQ